MRRDDSRPDRRGQAAAIAGVIAVAVTVIALATAQAFLVPQQNKETEIDHYETALEDMSDVRTAILDSARTSAMQSTTIDLGPEYRNRFVLQNPSPPSGSFAIERVGMASISNAAAVNPETRDFWSGDTRTGYPVGTVQYHPGYNYLEGTGTTLYENSVLYTKRGGDTNVRSGERLLDGTELNLVFLDGDRKLSSARTVTLEPERLSASENRVPMRSAAPGDLIVIRIPTRLSEERWRDLLEDELVSNGGHLVSPPEVVDGELVLELEGGVTYGMSMSRLGYRNSAPSVPAYITVVDVDQSVAESTTSEIVVEVRDQYNNPVSGVDLTAVQPTVGSLVGPESDTMGQVTATTDEDGRVTFRYRSPENVPQPDVLSQFSVVAEGINGPKGEVTLEVGVGDTPEPVSIGERKPLITGVQPNPNSTALGNADDGEFVRVSVPASFDPTGYTLDVENGDRSAVNTAFLDAGGLERGATAEVYVVENDSSGTTSLATLLATGDRERLDLYVVGPTVDDLEGFATGRGLANGTVVIKSTATGLVAGGLTDADADTNTDLLADGRGTVILRESDGAVADNVEYRSGPTGTIDRVVPRNGTADGEEFVALSFDRPTDLMGATLSLDSHGVNETVPLDAFTADLGTGLSGPIYVVGTGVGPATFAAEKGVGIERVRSVTALAGRETLANPDDVLGAHEGEVTLSVGGQPVDRFEYEDRALATLDEAVPVRNGTSSDEFVALVFDTVDTTGWTLEVADGDQTETFDLTSLSETTAAARGPVYLVGDDVAPATFAAEQNVPVKRVVRFADLTDALADADVLTDDGSTLTLRDGTGDTVDTLTYDGADAGRLTDVVPTRGADNTDEFARLAFGTATDTSGWTLTVEDTTGTVQTVPLDGIAGVADGPVYLVGQGTDESAFADARGVAQSQVVDYSDLDDTLSTDLYPAAGATLTLRDAGSEAVDSLSYGGTVTTGEITEISPVTGGDATREFVELSFDRSVDTTDWTLVTESGDGADAREVTYDLSGFAGATVTPGPIYLVGDGVDLSTFAADLGVSTDRVARFSDVVEGTAVVDALLESGAELSLVRDDGVVVDREFYGSEARPKADSTVDIGEDSTDQALYRIVDENGDPIDTDRADDWYYTDQYPPVQAGPVIYEEESIATATDGSLSFDVSNEGEGPTTVVGFAVETTLGRSLDAGSDRELNVVTGSPGYVNHPDGGFATSGVTYAFEADGYDGVPPVLDGGETATIELGVLRDIDGNAVDAGSLVESTAAEADLTVTFQLDDGTVERFHFQQRRADLAVDVTSEEEVVDVGADLDFEVTLTNGGPGRAAGPVAVDGLPGPDLTVNSAALSVGSYDSATGVWTLPDGLLEGETATLTVNTTTADDVSVGDTVTYGSAVASSGSYDPDAENDADEASVSVGGADLAITHSVAPNPIEQGSQTTLTVTVENLGPAGNDGPIVVSEQLPDELTYVSDTPEVGSYDPSTGEWTIPGGLADGESATLEVVARAELSGPTDVTARVADTGPVADGDDSNDAETVTVEVGPCSNYVQPGADVLLYETFETDGSTDAERLQNADLSGSASGVQGVDASTSAPSAPGSPPGACKQSAYTAEDSGTLFSADLDTSPYEQVVVGYWIRKGDSTFSEPPEDGEDLVVEYRSASGSWETIEEVQAADLADGETLEHEFVLPGDSAHHDGFQIRFRQVTADGDDSGTDDVWHVDNVYVVGSDTTGSIQPYVTDVRTYTNDSQTRFEATFGYENTYVRPVVVVPSDDNVVTPSGFDPALPTMFSPDGDADAVVVSGIEPSETVTWTVAGRSATAYGTIADLAVSMTTDDNDGETIQWQDLTYEVTVTNQGDPTGLTSGDVPGPVTFDVDVPEPADEGALTMVATSTSAGTYDRESNEWTLPDGLAPGEAETMEVFVKVTEANETTSTVAVGSTTTADTVPENDEDSVTIDPYPVNCRGVAYVAPDGQTIEVLTPAGQTETYGTASGAVHLLGPYEDLDDDGACEVTYIAGAEGTRNLHYLDDDGTETTFGPPADVSKSSLAVGDVDGDGHFSIFYADDADETLYRVEVADGSKQGGPVLVDGQPVDGNSGGAGYTDITGDGVPDTLYVESSIKIGIIDGATRSRTSIQTNHATESSRHHALGPPRPVDGRGPRMPVIDTDYDITLTDADGNTEVVYSDGGGTGSGANHDSDLVFTRFTLRDWDYDGAWEFIFMTSDKGLQLYDPGTGQVTDLADSNEVQTTTGVQ